jgi:hypothetical protein
MFRSDQTIIQWTETNTKDYKITLILPIQIQSAFQEKVPAGGYGLWCGSGGEFTGGWTTGLLLVENSMTHQGVTLLHTDRKHLAVESSV